MARLDLYINCTQNVTLSVQAHGNKLPEIHLSGYFEPKGDELEDEMFYGAEDDEEDDSDEEEGDDKAKKENLKTSLQ